MLLFDVMFVIPLLIAFFIGIGAIVFTFIVNYKTDKICRKNIQENEIKYMEYIISKNPEKFSEKDKEIILKK